MSRPSPDLIDRVKTAAFSELPELAEQVGYRWPARSNRRGRKLHCPFHTDRTPSAHLYPDKIHCFACGESLDVIDLEQFAEGGTVADAIHRLAARHGIDHGQADVNAAVSPRFDDQTLAEAALFRTALIWHTERELEAAKAPLLESPGGIDGERIFALTQMLAEVQAWSEYDAAEALTDLQAKQPEFVAELVTEAEEAHELLTNVIWLAGKATERVA
ncbi:MAG: CHC2 zinc finger domain-containing protein [Bryobacteraceae bacterium]